MKISIKPEPFLNNPKPKLTKAMFDYFWSTFWSFRLEYYVDCLETIDIRINQALPYTPVHFYVTINGVEEFHKEYHHDGINPLSHASENTRGSRAKGFWFVFNNILKSKEVF